MFSPWWIRGLAQKIVYWEGQVNMCKRREKYQSANLQVPDYYIFVFLVGCVQTQHDVHY